MESRGLQFLHDSGLLYLCARCATNHSTFNWKNRTYFIRNIINVCAQCAFNVSTFIWFIINVVHAFIYELHQILPFSTGNATKLYKNNTHTHTNSNCRFSITSNYFNQISK